MKNKETLTSCALSLAQRELSLRPRDIGGQALLCGKGMRFLSRVCDAEGTGSLFLMDMKAPLGLMKMQTAVFSPTALDGPILSMDFVEAFGTYTLVLELYDTTFSHPGFEPLEEVRRRYDSLPDYDPGEHWFDSMQLAVSAHKKGKKCRAEMLEMAKEYAGKYLELLRQCPACGEEGKKAENAKFADGLLKNGGPAVDTFRKMIGDEKTAAFIRGCMFCCV